MDFVGFRVGLGVCDVHQLYLRTFFFSSCPPSSPRGPGEGQDCHSPKDIDDFVPISARIRGAI